MAHARYYRFGGEPLAYMANWNGLPPAANTRSRELGEANFLESSASPDKRFRPVQKPLPRPKQKRGWTPAHERTILSVPLRPSGPEPLDPGAMPSWQSAYHANYMVQPVGELGPFGLSRNEGRALLVAAAGVAGLVWWKKRKKRR